MHEAMLVGSLIFLGTVYILAIHRVPAFDLKKTTKKQPDILALFNIFLGYY